LLPSVDEKKSQKKHLYVLDKSTLSVYKSTETFNEIEIESITKYSKHDKLLVKPCEEESKQKVVKDKGATDKVTKPKISSLLVSESTIHLERVLDPSFFLLAWIAHFDGKFEDTIVDIAHEIMGDDDSHKCCEEGCFHQCCEEDCHKEAAQTKKSDEKKAEDKIKNAPKKGRKKAKKGKRAQNSQKTSSRKKVSKKKTLKPSKSK
jgi:hypothetical protein